MEEDKKAPPIPDGYKLAEVGDNWRGAKSWTDLTGGWHKTYTAEGDIIQEGELEALEETMRGLGAKVLYIVPIREA